MTRDMDLVRKILFELEKHKGGFAPPNLRINGYSDEQIGFHVHLMGEAGLVQVADVTPYAATSPQALAKCVTWEGYEFLEAARSLSIWERAKHRIAKEGLGMSLEVLKGLLKVLAKEALHLP